MRCPSCHAALFAAGALLVTGTPDVLAQGMKPAKPAPAPAAKPASEAPAAADLTPAELYEQGRAAFAAQDYPKAGSRFTQLIADYGSNAEVAPLIDECRPMLALCQVKGGAFDDALATIDAALKNEKLPAAARSELSFWRGICLLQTGDIATAQEQFGEFYAIETNDRTRRFEAFLLFGTGYVQLKDYDGAADFFASQIHKLPPDQTEVAGRATLLHLHSLMEAGRTDNAVALIRRTWPRMESLTQPVAFQLLTLSLGARCLEEDLAHSAIACFQHLWPRRRLLEHQQKQLALWQERRTRLRSGPGSDEALRFQADAVISRIERELAQFTAIESYDAALQLRLAQAFMSLQRWREAGLLLDHAAATLEPDPTVERAALTAIDCWQQTGDNLRVIAAADRYLTLFSEHRRGDHVPDALFAKGEGLRGDGRHEEAQKCFGDIANDFPSHAIAPRAMLMGGICQLESGRSDAALTTLQALRLRFKKGPLHEDALFWEGMALSMERQYDDARERLAAAIAAYPRGRYAAQAAFERARCLHNQTRHTEATAEFRAWLKSHPAAPQAAEATLLLAESLMATGDMDDGLALLDTIPASEARMHEEAQFKKGEALRKLGQNDDALRHYESFAAAHPYSRRLAEAAHWQARTAQALGKPEAARALVWTILERPGQPTATDTIEGRTAPLKLGNDPASEGVEDLLTSLPRLYRGPDELRKLTGEFEDRAAAARKAGQKTLALRLTWAHAHAVRSTAPGEAQNLFFSLADLIDPAIHPTRIIADCADAWRETQGQARAKQLYTDLRKWHPRAVEKERASFGLGMIALAAGDEAGALQWFDRCLAESVAGGPGIDAAIQRATLLRRQQRLPDAVTALEKVTANRLATPSQKARALLLLGYCAMDAGDLRHAAVHFERCALSGAKFKDTAAEARLQHGLVLEKLQDQPAALAAYRALLERKDLAALAPARTARERLTALEAGTP